MNRRTFTLSAAAASSSLLAANDTIEAGVIGTGGRGTYLLTNAIKVGGVRFTHLCDINPNNLDKALTAAAASQPKSHKDYRELLAAASIDAVFIATPCHLHKEMVIAALEAGKDVYLEKPMALTPEDNRAIVDAARRAKGIVQIGFNGRYAKLNTEVLRRIHGGDLGKLLFLRGQYWTPRDLPRHQEWKFRRHEFGDMIVEQAVHNFDRFNWIFGGPPVRACGLGGINLYSNEPPDRTIMDHYTISYEYPGGAHVNFSHIYYGMGDFTGVGELVVGSDGAVALDRSGAKFYRRNEKQPVETIPADRSDNSTQNAIGSFFTCVRRRTTPFSNVDVGRLGALA
ncbi:MAG: Gfo/Idh/MocA family oxidoreductase, partial [bacterium]|nr:Gfo/Idh/MocA family oxidoreductase [bacterium]